MENTLSALVDAMSSMKKVKRQATEIGDFAGSDYEGDGVEDPTSPESAAAQKRMAELRAQQLENEVHELREYFYEVSSSKKKAEDKVLSLESFGGLHGVSSAKRYADESNQRARAMVSYSVHCLYVAFDLTPTTLGTVLASVSAAGDGPL